MYLPSLSMQNKILSKMLFLITIFQIRIFRIRDNSMYPAILNNQVILVNTSNYQKQNIKRGDLIIFRVTRIRTIKYIKRVVGIPKDKITITQNSIKVNGKDIYEDYFNYNIYEEGSWLLSDKEYFVLADNRKFSSMADSRKLGAIDKSNIVGKVIKIFN